MCVLLGADLIEKSKKGSAGDSFSQESIEQKRNAEQQGELLLGKEFSAFPQTRIKRRSTETYKSQLQLYLAKKAEPECAPKRFRVPP